MQKFIALFPPTVLSMAKYYLHGKIEQTVSNSSSFCKLPQSTVLIYANLDHQWEERIFEALKMGKEMVNETSFQLRGGNITLFKIIRDWPITMTLIRITKRTDNSLT